MDCILQADATTLDFESKLRDFLLEFGETKIETEGLSFFVAVARGYADVASEQMQGDTFLLPLGFLGVTIYAVFMLGHLSCVENRVSYVS